MSMVDAKSLSKMIRSKKMRSLRPDMDDAGQEAVDPNEAWDAKQAHEVNEALDDPDHEPASEAEMGENESSQDIHQLKRAVSRINKYFDSL
jgi:hypothetical protein